MASKFANWAQTVLTANGGYKRPTPEEAPIVENAHKKQRAAPKLTPTVNLKPTFVPAVFLETSEDGSSEMEVCGYIQGRVQHRKKGSVATLVLDSGTKMLVEGDFVIEDPYFIYRMKCVRTMEAGKILMKMKQKLDPFLVPRPIGGYELKKVLQRKLKLDNKAALELTCRILKSQMTEKLGTPVERLKQISLMIADIFGPWMDELWYKKLAECWAPLKLQHIHILGNFWTQRQLQMLSTNEINTIVDKMKENPLSWMLKECNPHDLPHIETTEKNVSTLKTVLSVEISETDVKVVNFYNRICDLITESGRISLTRDDLAKISECGHADPSNLIPACLSNRYKLLVRVYKDDQRFYRTKDHTALLKIRMRLNTLMHKPPDSLEIVPTFKLVTPSQEQMAAVDAIATNQNVLLLLGDAGTGKTETGKAIFKIFKRGVVRAVAAYGEPALRQKEMYGDGQTIDMFLNKIQRGTKSGQKLVVRTKVLIIDEIGIVTVRKFAKLLDCLPELTKLCLIGDEKQLDPVSAGPIMHSLIRKWSGTPYLHRLTKVFRVDNESQILVENFRAYLEGSFQNIKYTNDMLSKNPMKLIQRLPIPEYLKYPSNDAQRLERFSYYLQQMTELHHQFIIANKSFDDTRILVQREVDVAMMNHVMFEILNRGTGRDYSPHVFYVGERICFKQNMILLRPDWTQQVACSKEIANNRTATIIEIYDVDPHCDYLTAMQTKISLRSTSEKKSNEAWTRVVKFNDSTQVNLDDYPIIWIRRAYATTIASTIGSEVNRVVVYIHPWSNFFHRGVLYTAMTRAKKEVVLIMDYNGDPKLNQSDLAKIWHTPPPPPENVLSNYIPCNDPLEEDRVQRPEFEFHHGTHIDDLSEVSEEPEEDPNIHYVNSRTITQEPFSNLCITVELNGEF
jgi:hypothetical protein